MSFEPSGPDIDKFFTALLAGIPGSEEELLAQLRPGLLDQANMILVHTNLDPQDMVQDSLISLLNVFRNGKPENLKKIRTYAAIVVRNRCRDALRRRKRWLPLPHYSLEGTLGSDLDDPLQSLVEVENRDGVRRALAQLEQDCRELLKALYHHNLKAKRLAQKLGLNSVQHLYWKRDRCLKKLKDLILKTDGPGVYRENQ